MHSVENADESTELNSLLRECIDETEVGGRAQAVLNLIELVAADFPDEDEDGIEGDDDGGEVRHEPKDFLILGYTIDFTICRKLEMQILAIAAGTAKTTMTT